ncbi:MAG: hypothetical protein DRN71_01275 [Candidatus Nanohalarchaeota archaeon]|nr:MAG: hypothetical protein DRN71_01275 [Candidatus Nanohaloarchaeota archaeon]
MNARAYCPGHISCIFRVCVHDDVLRSGSRGAGIVIDEGVETSVETCAGSGVVVYLNGEMTDFCVSFSVIKKMGVLKGKRIVVRHVTKLPCGAGFGVSGACAVGVGMCLNEVFSLGMSVCDIGRAAHAAEVECGTGLGDVGPMLFGGVELRKKEGAPGYCVIENVDTEMRDLVCFSFGGVDTNEVIGKDGFSELNVVADDVLERLFCDPVFENFMKCSVEFSQKAGFGSGRLLDVIRRLNRIEGCFASQTMLGESGFVFVGRDMNKKVLDELEGVGCVFKTKVGYRLPELL